MARLHNRKIVKDSWSNGNSRELILSCGHSRGINVTRHVDVGDMVLCPMCKHNSECDECGEN